jgi:hypothetical protein
LELFKQNHATPVPLCHPVVPLPLTMAASVDASGIVTGRVEGHDVLAQCPGSLPEVLV